MNGSKTATSDLKSEGEGGEKSTFLQNVGQQPTLFRATTESIKCGFTTSVRPTFASPRPVIAVQPSTVPVSGSPVAAGATTLTTIATAQPVISKTGVVQSGSTLSVCAPMASIIRDPVGSHPQSAFSSHSAIQATYSSHVPRGPAAVACMTTTKSAVATPIPRSHILGSNIVSSTGNPHLMQPRLSGINPIRRSFPTVSRMPTFSASTSDISHISTSTTSNPTPTQIVLAGSRTGDTTLRPAIVHGTAVISKSHSFVQHVPQISSLEKGFYKPNITQATILTSQVTTTVSSTTTHVTPHIAVGQQSSQIQSLSVTLPSTIALSSSTAQIHLPIHPQLVSHSISLAGAPVGSIAPSNVSSSITHTPANLSKVHKGAHTVTPVTHFQPNNLAVSSRTIKTVVSQSGTKPLVYSGASTLSTTIPVAKVYPQPLTVVTKTPPDIVPGEINRTPSQATLFVPPTHRTSLPHLTVSTNPVYSTSGNPATVAGAPSTTSSVIVTENRTERPVISSSYNFSPAPAAYYYDPNSTVPNTLTMHSLSGSSSTSHSFTAVSTNIRTGFTPHPSPGIKTTSTSSVNVNPVMMAVASTRSPQMLSSLSESTTVSSASPSVTYSNSGTTTASPIASASSSPRPSILRKRTIDGTQVSSAAKRNLLPCLSPSKSSQSEVTPVPATNISVQAKTNNDRDPGRENGQLPEAVISNTNSVAPFSVSVKQEPIDQSDSVATSVASLLQLGPVAEASPRKKPRKQQLTGNELVETHSTEGEEEFEKEPKDTIKKEVVQEDSNRGSWISRKNRSPVTLLNSYRHTWKSRNNHFLRYTDVKPREERRPTVFELANQKWVTQKVNGWKVHHLCAQMEDVVDLEGSVHSRLMALLEEMEKKEKTKDEDDIDLDRTIELMRGNIQRCKLISDQMKDAKQQILKILDHKTCVSEIVSKYIPKQTSRRREKVLLY